MPGEKQVPSEALPPQEKIAQLLDKRLCIAVAPEKTLAETLSQFGEEGYSLSRFTLVFRALETRGGVGEVETLHVLEPEDPFTGRRVYRRFVGGREIPTIIQPLEIDNEVLSQLTGGEGNIHLPIAKNLETREPARKTLEINFQDCFIIPKSEETPDEAIERLGYIYSSFAKGPEAYSFEFDQRPSPVAVLDSGRFIYLESDEQGGWRGFWQRHSITPATQEMHQFRAREIRVTYLNDAMATPRRRMRVGGVGSRAVLDESSLYAQGSIVEGGLAHLSFEGGEGDVPTESAWREVPNDVKPGIERIVKIVPLESK